MNQKGSLGVMSFTLNQPSDFSSTGVMQKAGMVTLLRLSSSAGPVAPVALLSHVETERQPCNARMNHECSSPTTGRAWVNLPGRLSRAGDAPALPSQVRGDVQAPSTLI